MDRQSLFKKYQVPLICAALVLLVIAAFEPVRHNGFVNFDDERYFYSNVDLQAGLSWDSVKWAFTTNYAAYWCPTTWLSFLLDVELFGLNPVTFHIHNVVLHVASVVLLFLILRHVTGSLWCSALTAAFFGIHPLRVESVAWAVERKDVLYAFFWMLTIAAYVSYVRRGGWARYLLVVLCLSLGLMAKPMMVTLPAILLILDFWPLGRTNFLPPQNPIFEYKPIPPLRLLLEKIPLLILSALTCVMIYRAHHAGGVINYLEVNRLNQFANVPVSYVLYLKKIFWPVNLAVLYPFPEHGWPVWIPVLSLLLLAALTICVFVVIKKYPFLAAGWLWFILTLLPVIGLVQIASQSIADRYTYLPSVGIFIMAIWGIRHLIGTARYRVIVFSAGCVVLIAAMIAAARTQVSYWRDSITLYRHTVAVTKDNYIIAGNLGACLMDKGQFKEAQTYLAQSLSIRPDHYESNLNMADVLKELKQYDQAMVYIDKAIQLRPLDSSPRLIQGGIFKAAKQPDKALEAFDKAIALDPNDFRPFYDAGFLLNEQGKPDKAVQYFKECLRCNPKWAIAHRDMGIALQRMGQNEDALASFRLALQSIPDDYITCYRTGMCFQSLGRPKDAIAFYRKALTQKPNLWQAIDKLAWVLAASSAPDVRNPSEAVELALKAAEITNFGNYQVLDTLAAAYAANQQFDQAIKTMQKAIEMAQTKNDTNSIKAMTERLELYQNNTPFVESSSEVQK